MCTGGVWPVYEVLSPNVHAQLVGVPVEASVNVTFKGTDPPVVDELKAATGAAGTADVTVTVCVAVLVPPTFETVRVIV